MAMTRQEIFDKVATHLATQGKAASELGICRYRLGDLSCAIGCLIPDAKYDPKMEGMSLINIVRELGGILDINDIIFLQELQMVHDTTYGSIKEALSDFASKYALDSSILSTLTFPNEWGQ